MNKQQVYNGGKKNISFERERERENLNEMPLSTTQNYFIHVIFWLQGEQSNI